MRHIKVRSFAIRSNEEMEAAFLHYRIEGYVAVSFFASDADRIRFCERCAREIWDTTFHASGLHKEIYDQVKVKDIADLDVIMGHFPGSKRAQDLKKLLGDNPFFHSGFGAPAFGRTFNLDVQWELRNNPVLASFAKRVFGPQHDVHNTTDRCILKLPGKGEQSFLHLDQAPFSWTTTPDEGAASSSTNANAFQQINGKLVCSDHATFICCPGSHTQGDAITELYKPLYPNVNTKSMKFALDPRKPDPLDLYKRTVALELKKGDFIYWSEQIFHGVKMNTSGRVQFGLYLGFISKVKRNVYLQSAGVPEYIDRYNTWRYGTKPRAYPSGDPTQLYPLKFQNFPSALDKALVKMDKQNPRFDFTPRLVKTGPRAGQPTPHLVEVADPDYTPVKLSQTGREMLVGKGRVHEFDFSLA
jgi:hypothetical protein